MKSLGTWAVVVSGVLALAVAIVSCGGGNVVTTTDSCYHRGYYGTPYKHVDDYYDVQYTSYSYRRAISVITDQCETLIGDSTLRTENLLTSLEWGVNNVDPDHYTIASNNVELDERDDFPEIGLVSDSGGTSFVVYCFEPLYDLEYISSVEIEGMGFFNGDSESGLYVGIRRPGYDEYSWYGPLTSQREWVIELPDPRSLVQPRGNYYVALVVTDGDEVEITNLVVNVET